jgi:DNA primase
MFFREASEACKQPGRTARKVGLLRTFVGVKCIALISQATITAIIDATRIEEVVGEFVTLRRRGSNLSGLCPFHFEKSPSFNVNPARNMFKCFGCGKAGDAITFLIEHEKTTYPEALRWLARKYNIEVEEKQVTPEQLVQFQREDAMYVVNAFALKHFQDQLLDTDEGRRIALSYFKHRGLREETLKTFGLGYAPEGQDHLLRHAKQAGHPAEMLHQVGLCNPEGTRDFFRGRVMFAIHNLSGKVAAFAGRTLSASPNIPKYINSPETEIYVKNKTLYGAFQARRAMRQLDECILVEGYMDVISLHQAGIENVVASSGTALTEGQLRLIRRHASSLVILYDGDKAGIQAALRGLDLALEQQLDVRIVLLPTGEDPDSYVQTHGGEALRDYLRAHGVDFIVFKANLLIREGANDPIRKAEGIRDMVSSIARVADPIKRTLYIQQCSRLMGVDEAILTGETNKVVQQHLEQQHRKAARQAVSVSDNPDTTPPPDIPAVQASPASGSDELVERDVLRLVMFFGDRPFPNPEVRIAEYILTEISEALDEFDNALYAEVLRECRQLLDRGEWPRQHFFLHHPLEPIRRVAAELLGSPWEMSHNWVERWNYPLQNQPMPDDNFVRDTALALDRFKFKKMEKLIAKNLTLIRDAESRGDVDALTRHLRVDQRIRTIRNQLFTNLGGAIVPR